MHCALIIDNNFGWLNKTPCRMGYRCGCREEQREAIRPFAEVEDLAAAFCLAELRAYALDGIQEILDRLHPRTR